MDDEASLRGRHVVIVGGMLATEGTIYAGGNVCRDAGDRVLESLFLMKLIGLGARDTIAPLKAHALHEFPA